MLEALGINVHLVFAARQGEDLIIALVIAGDDAFLARGDISDGDPGFRQHCARGVVDRSDDGAEDILSMG